jgi:hypothetical protein
LTPYTDAELVQGVTPCCNAPLGPPPGTPRQELSTPARDTAPAPRRAGLFLLGLALGCVAGSGALWAALQRGESLPDDWVEQTAAFQAVRDQKAAADHHAREAEANRQAADQHAREAEAGRQAAESARAEAVTALDAANREVKAVRTQRDDAQRRLRDALDGLAQERDRRTSVEAGLAETKKPGPAPTHSFVRDWQLLGVFASTAGQAHDAVFPPDREPVQLEKAYVGFRSPVRWQPYHSPEDRIDLAGFFKYKKAGVAYAVSWAYADADQAVTLGVGSDDGIRLWVNGEQVHAVKGERQARPGQDMVKARLKQGWNEVRAKVDNITGTWEMYLEFRTADGKQPLRLFSTSSPPPAGDR